MDAALRQFDFVQTEVDRTDRAIAEQALASVEIRRLMTIPGVDVTTAATLMAAIGEIERFPNPRCLVGYLGLDPRPRQSGASKPRQGRISKEGSAAARHALVEARLVGGESAGTAARLRRAHRRPPRPSDRGGRSRPQAGRARLAPLVPWRGQRLPAPLRRSPQAAPARAQDGGTPGKAPSRRRRSGAAAPNTTSSANSLVRPSSPTAASSPTGSARGRRAVRVRHRGARLLGRRSGTQRGRRQLHLRARTG